MRKTKTDQNFCIDDHNENLIIRMLIIGFWTFFWFFNVVDKLIPSRQSYFVGTDRVGQFGKYLGSVGLENPKIIAWTIGIIAVLEFVAFLAAGYALWLGIKGNEFRARDFFFVSILTTLITFTLFIIAPKIRVTYPRSRSFRPL